MISTDHHAPGHILIKLKMGKWWDALAGTASVAVGSEDAGSEGARDRDASYWKNAGSGRADIPVFGSASSLVKVHLVIHKDVNQTGCRVKGSIPVLCDATFVPRTKGLGKCCVGTWSIAQPYDALPGSKDVSHTGMFLSWKLVGRRTWVMASRERPFTECRSSTIGYISQGGDAKV
jgi:hypothetical protein